MFKIENGRETFYQWDSEQRLIVNDDTIKEVHFCNRTDSCSLPCEVYKEDGVNLVNVPNILLQNDWDINVYGYDTNYTKYAARFKVNSRTKPADYVYTETELCTVQSYVEKALQEAKESGDFTGPAGPQGPAGSLKMIPVNELPTENIQEGCVYSLPAENPTENNQFDEYYYENGKWERWGGASIGVDLTEYVKNTDYALNGEAGVFKTPASGNYGLEVIAAENWAKGCVRIIPATKARIDSARLTPENGSYFPITCDAIEYAVMLALTNPVKQEWTDEQKTAARTLLGITLDDYLKKSTDKQIVYGTNANGAETFYTIKSSAQANSIALRETGGALNVGTPTADAHATTKAYVDGRITANTDGTLTITLADGTKYTVNATKEG